MQRPPGSDSASRRAATFETDDSGRVGNCFNCVICSNERAHEGENYDEPCILFFSSRVVELVDRRASRGADNLAIQIPRSRGGHCTEGDGPRPRRRRLSGAGWGATEQGGLFVGGIAGGNALEGVPQDLIAAGALVGQVIPPGL